MNGTSPDLHRVVTHLKQADGNKFDKVFVQYYFDKEPHYFQPFPCENSKTINVTRELMKHRRPASKV